MSSSNSFSFRIFTFICLNLFIVYLNSSIILIDNPSNVSDSPFISSSPKNFTDPLCKTFKNNACVECSVRSFFNNQSVCQQVNPNCKTWDKLNGNCLSCYEGSVLQTGDCIQNNETNAIDPLCSKFDWQKQVCLQCSQRSFKNKEGICTQVPPECKTSVQLNCTSCYQGYQLKNGKCIMIDLSKSSSNQPSDPGCAKWNWQTQKCLQCSTRFYFNAQRICTPVSDLCNTYDTSTGACLTCYSGYALNGTTCVLSQENNNTNPNNNTVPSSDPNCKTFDQTSKTCLQCSYRFYLANNGLCAQVSDQCQTWNSNDGLCTSCYQGYELSQGTCILGNNNSTVDPNCAKYDQTKTICFQCSKRYFFNKNKICTLVSPQCQTWNPTDGSCTSCYQGYTLSNGVCSSGSNQNNTIPDGCSSYNSQTNTCQSCDQNYCMSQGNLCVLRPVNCQICQFSGGCAKCNTGYVLQNGQCTQSNNSACIQYQGNSCVQCQPNYFLFNGSCLSDSQIVRILNLYYGGNSGNSGTSNNGSEQASQSSNNQPGQGNDSESNQRDSSNAIDQGNSKP